jgi:hypothetical protein
MPVTIVVPLSPNEGDPRCEWDGEEWLNTSGNTAIAVSVCLAGLAAELNAGVPERIAWGNSSEDIADLDRSGLPDCIIQPLLSEVQGVLDDDNFFRFLEWLREEVAQDGLRMHIAPRDLLHFLQGI